MALSSGWAMGSQSAKGSHARGPHEYPLSQMTHGSSILKYIGKNNVSLKGLIQAVRGNKRQKHLQLASNAHPSFVIYM